MGRDHVVRCAGDRRMAGPRGRPAARGARADRSRVRARRRGPPDTARRMSDLTLALDGSTYSASVALLDGDKLIAQRQLSNSSDANDGGRGEGLAPLIIECLKETGHAATDIKSVVCGS